MKTPSPVALLLAVLVASSVFAQDRAVDTSGINYRYKQNYYFITMPDTIFTFESEFDLPEGFRHADSSELSDFQNYVANFALWHRYMKVGNWKKRTIYDEEEVSRPVHLPYYGNIMSDHTIPIRILAEFLVDRDRKLELNIVPNNGDTMMFSKWLLNEIVYGPRRAVMYRPVSPKDTTLKEYYSFMTICMDNTTYSSLAYNCDSVNAADIMPGDIFVAHDEKGRKGITYVIMHMITNDKGQKLYAVATGCEEACDFHIPIFNNDRDNPWINAKEISSLGLGFAHSGFLRFKIH